MMTQVKILVHNINDVVNRAAFEAELNVYLKMSWSLKETHQAVSPETGFLMMTAVLEKDASTSSANEKEAGEEATDASTSSATGKQEEVKEKSTVKESADASTSSATSKQEAEKEKAGSEKNTSDGETMPKGFKIKEPGEDNKQEAVKEKEEKPEKNDAGEKEEKE